MQKTSSPPMLTALLLTNVVLTGALVAVALMWPLGGGEDAQAAFAVEAAPQTWEYRCLETDREVASGHAKGFPGHLEETFGALGKDGWEMVGYAMNNGANVRYVCFKRPVKPT